MKASAYRTFCLALLCALCAGAASAAEPTAERRLTVKQDPGKVLYWVLPGKRRLDPHVFGTPPELDEDFLLETKLERARQLVDEGKIPHTVPGLLEDLPILVGLPEAWWKPENDEILQEEGQYVLQKHTFFPDAGIPVAGEPGKENWFELTYVDRTPEDKPGFPTNTDDEIELEMEFHDPAGNRYELEIFHVVMPPIPGYDTRGGVMIDDWHHGRTGTGAPLMPKVYSFGAYWAIGRLSVNGGPPMVRITHGMTTEVVRDKDYRLPLTDELPLKPEERINPEKSHHTHLVVLAVEPTADGPVHAPVETAYEVPSGPLEGEKQPYIHLMWEDEEIVAGKEHLKRMPDHLELD